MVYQPSLLDVCVPKGVKCKKTLVWEITKSWLSQQWEDMETWNFDSQNYTKQILLADKQFVETDKWIKARIFGLDLFYNVWSDSRNGTLIQPDIQIGNYIQISFSNFKFCKKYKNWIHNMYVWFFWIIWSSRQYKKNLYVLVKANR